jgi:hypothetical protein
MSVKVITLQQFCKPTESMGWHRRRLTKMIQAIFSCAAYADPSGIFDLQVYTDVNSVGVYTITLITEESDDMIDQFIRYARQVKYFHTVTLTINPDPVTIPT